MESKSPEVIFIEISKVLDVPIRFETDEKSLEKVSPQIDPTAILSKFLALMVYVGWNVPVSLLPAYNRIHADVEYWKKRLETKPEVASDGNTQPQ